MKKVRFLKDALLIINIKGTDTILETERKNSDVQILVSSDKSQW